jgi:membrane protease YdiL (CAAX protease family)
MLKTLRWPIFGVLTAITVTTIMDANGLSVFSALPLFPLMGLFWYLQRLSRLDVGFKWGEWRHYGIAILYPLVVPGLVALFAAVTGNVDSAETDWQKVWLNLALMTIITVLIVIITEEGFFRGWLWASLKNAGLNKIQILIWTSVAFSLWHLSVVTLETGFNLPAAQVPVFILNAAILGAIWGMLRMISGSVIVASVSHGLWNGIVYVFFGFGTEVGALNISATGIYEPEVGILGLILNLIFALALWRWCMGKND